jgi:hypothetical protein
MGSEARAVFFLLHVTRLSSSPSSFSFSFSFLLFSHELSATLAGGETVLSGHEVQVSLPEVALKVPAAQAVHCPPLVPVYPGLQAQSVVRVLPAGDDDLS